MPTLLDRLSARIAYHHARGVYRRFLRNAGDAVRVQDNVLAGLVRRHAPSAFGADHGFDRLRGYDDFVRRVPVRSYDDLRAYVDCVIAGESMPCWAPARRS